MKMPKEQLNALLDGIEPKLFPFLENTTRVRKCKGSFLLAKGIKEANTKGGILMPVSEFGEYMYSTTVKVPVNHRRRMRAIIEEAKTEDEMIMRLGEYQSKFGNPVFFKTQNKN